MKLSYFLFEIFELYYFLWCDSAWYNVGGIILFFVLNLKISKYIYILVVIFIFDFKLDVECDILSRAKSNDTTLKRSIKINKHKYFCIYKAHIQWDVVQHFLKLLKICEIIWLVELHPSPHNLWLIV